MGRMLQASKRGDSARGLDELLGMASGGLTRGYSRGGDVDPEDFLAAGDTLSTADRTRMINGKPYTTHVDAHGHEKISRPKLGNADGKHCYAEPIRTRVRKEF